MAKTVGSTPSNMQQVPRKGVKNECGNEKEKGPRTAPLHHAGLVRTRTRTFLRKNALMQGMPTTALRCDKAVSEFQKHLRVRNFYEPEERVSHDLIPFRNASLCATRPFVTSWLPRTVQCLCSNVFIAYHPQPRPWMVWRVWSTNGSGWTSGPSSSPPQTPVHFSWWKGSNANCGTPLRMTIGPWSATNRNSITTRGMVGVAGMVAEWLSLDERLIFHSVSLRSFHFSSRRSSSVGFWVSLQDDICALLGNERERYCYEA